MIFKTPVLRTSRLLIRPLKKSDVKNFYSLLKENKNRIKEDFPVTVKNSSTIEKTTTFLNALIKDKENKSQVVYGLWIEKELIGCISIIKIDWSVPKCELAYHIKESHEGMGFITEAVKCISSFCFTELEMVKICIRTNKKNSRSQNTALAAGFIKEAILRDEFRTGHNKIVDLVYYGLTQRRFNRIKKDFSN